MPKTHNILLYYRNTLKTSSPLVLIVGREPNNTVPFDNKLGKYDLAKRKGGWYWKRTHKYLGNIAGIRDFRKACIKDGYSPIIYADISPMPLKHHKKGKKRLRRSITEEAFKAHIDRIFSHKKLMNRVKLIILGIGDRKEFSEAATYFKRKTKKRIIETPFLINYNRPKIMKILSRHKSKIKKIIL